MDKVDLIASLITDNPDVISETMYGRQENDKNLIEIEAASPDDLRKLAAALEAQGVDQFVGTFRYKDPMRTPPKDLNPSLIPLQIGDKYLKIDKDHLEDILRSPQDWLQKYKNIYLSGKPYNPKYNDPLYKVEAHPQLFRKFLKDYLSH